MDEFLENDLRREAVARVVEVRSVAGQDAALSLATSRLMLLFVALPVVVVFGRRASGR
jgi:hypothetical protein